MRKLLPFVAVAVALAGCVRSEHQVSSGTSPAKSAAAGRSGPTSAIALGAIRGRIVHGQRYASLPDRGELLAYTPGAPEFRTRAYTWKQVQLSEQHALDAIGGTMTVEAPDGHLIRLRYDHHVEHANGDWTWVGRPAGAQPGTEAIITFGEKAAFGSIPDGAGPPLRLMQAEGVSWLVKTDAAALASIPGAHPAAPDAYPVPRAALRPASDSASPASGAAPTSAAAGAAASTTVDVVLGYTTTFASRLGGQSQANTRLNNMIDFANQAYQNSGIDARVRLVSTVQVDYADNTNNDQALYDLTGKDCSGKSCVNRTIPPSLQPLRAARDQYGADLMSLVRNFDNATNGSCGVGWILGGGQRAIISADEAWAMSIVSDSNGRGPGSFPSAGYVCRDETLAHEMGHNMGAQHDVATARGDNNVLDPEEYGRYSYSFGFKTDANTGNFYTIMAYGDSGQTAYRIFSNPRSNFCGGNLCGSNQADNALTLSQTMSVIAGFRATVVPLPTGNAMLTRDVNADSTEDVVWYNAGTRELYAWFMSAWLPSTGASGGPALVGTSPRGVADFGGDGRSDVLLSDGTNVYMLTGNGSGGYSAAYVGAHPPGYNVLATQDADADGKADVIWYNASSGALLIWKMNGAVLSQSIAAGSVIGGTTPLAVGDTNGDRRADIVLASPQNVYMLNGTGSTFTAAYVAARPIGWTLLASRDVDADGKADFLWYNPQTREVYYWIMNGSTPVTGRGGSYAIGGTTPVTVGDYNGDGRADILLSSGSNLYMLRGNAGGTFDASYVAAYPTGWTALQ